MIRTIKRKFKNWFFGNLNQEITPDEVFLDSTNLPGFDTDQFEGRLEKPISLRVMGFLAVFFIVILLIFSSRLWLLQVRKGDAYLERSENNRLRNNLLFSNRGVVYDRIGTEIVSNTIHPSGEEYSLREYSKIPGLSHLIGYVKYPTKDSSGFYYQTDFIGKDGVEKYYGDTLLGENGLQIIEMDALGKIHSQSTTKLAVDGESLDLSIDSRVQSELFRIISETAEQFGFQGGAGVMMDVRTGELLALTSFPEYDLETLSLGSDVSEIDSLLDNSQKPFLNRVISGLYTPGSIVKPFLAIGALNEEIISPQKKIFSSGSLSVPNPYFPDKPSIFNDWKAHGWVDMVDAIAFSSNVYFYEIGGGFGDQKGLGISKIEEYLRMFGLGEKSGIDLPGEVLGIIPNPSWKMKNFNEEWRLGDTYNTAIGQYGFQVTPIQVLRGISAIANEGTLLEPTVLKTDEPSNGKTIDIKPNIFDTVKTGMRQSVEKGTASGLSVPFVKIAAKTGTAEIGKSFLNSWVIGFFPYNDPKFAFVVIMERGPRGNSVGGVYVMSRLLNWMNINTPKYLD